MSITIKKKAKPGVVHDLSQVDPAILTKTITDISQQNMKNFAGSLGVDVSDCKTMMEGIDKMQNSPQFAALIKQAMGGKP